MKWLSSIIILLAISQAFAGHYKFEFGQNYGDVIYRYDGVIPFLQTNTKLSIPVPPGVGVTYVLVIVDAVSTPKVDFLHDTNEVSINYSWTQLSLSTYSVLVKGL
ncbi:uncharacterized protein LOC124538407 [Vanessa cardui]|uniref:uncharacterized protein LOC124538407 n=1 Tax=Vanessa cardui TaxID=171605 RepID=UPI001F13E99D|nr:uncharacterized protein LOC124538407 [Vanessa cardui]